MEEREEIGQLEELSRLGFSAEQADLLFEQGVPASFAGDWRHEFPSDSAEEIAGFFAFPSDEGIAWRRHFFTLQEAVKWSQCLLDPEEAEEVSSVGVTPEGYKQWTDLFPLPDITEVLSEIRKVRPELTDFSACLALRSAVGEDYEWGLSEWLHSGFSTEQIARLSEAGVTSTTARLWRSEMPECIPETILAFHKVEWLETTQAIHWVAAFPDFPLDKLVFLASNLGSLGLLQAEVATYTEGDFDPADVLARLELASGFIQNVSRAASDSSAVHYNRNFLGWMLAFPELSPEEIREFVEQAQASIGDALEWHLAFPDDSSAQAARYLALDVPIHWLRLMRQDFPDLDPEQVLLLYNSLRDLFSVEGEWQACINWQTRFPEWSHQQILDFCSALPFTGISQAFAWVAYDSNLSSPEVLAMTAELTGASPPEQADIRFMSDWIGTYPDDSPEDIKAWLDAFDERETALEWRSSDLEPDEAASFYDSLFYREPDFAIEYKSLGIDPVTAGEWDCVFRETDFSLPRGLSEWLEVFPEMSVERVYEAAQWFHYGFDSSSEVAGWIGQQIDIFDALLFVACGCREPEIARAWLDRGFSGPDASRLLGDSWLTPAELEAASGVELSLDNQDLLAAFREQGFDLEEAGRWLSSGVVSPSVAKEWKEAGFGPASSALWLSVDCPSPEMALVWWQQGATPVRAGQLLAERGLSFEELPPEAFKSSFDWQTRDEFAPAERLN